MAKNITKTSRWVDRSITPLTSISNAGFATSAGSSVDLSNYYTSFIIDASFYNKAISDARFVNVAGDTMTGKLVVDASFIVSLSGDRYFDINSNTGNSKLGDLDDIWGGNYLELDIPNDDSLKYKKQGNTVFELDGTGDIFVKGSAVVQTNNLIGSTPFVSGFTGSGWRLNNDSSVYSAEFDNLVVRRGMRVYELEIEKIRVNNGSLLISNGAKITGVTGIAPNAWDLDIDASVGQPFAVNDVVRVQNYTGNNVKYYAGYLNIVSNTQVRLQRTDGTDDPEVGDDLVRMGNRTNINRQGYIYLTASDSGAPFIDIMDGVTSEVTTAFQRKARLGNITGLGYDSSYGIVTEYGGIGNWNIGNGAIYTGIRSVSDGYSTTGITLDGSGAIHAENFYINIGGDVAAKNISLETKAGGSSIYPSTLRIDASGIYESARTDTNGGVRINWAGYQSGQTYLKNTWIYNGRGDEMLVVNANNDTVETQARLQVTAGMQYAQTNLGFATHYTCLTGTTYVNYNYTIADGSIDLYSNPATGQQVIFTNETTGRNVTIYGNGNNIIDSGATYTTRPMIARSSFTMIFNGRDWHVTSYR